jgi:hypothetical protein
MRPGDRLGGIEGNETLTSAVAAVLTVLLLAEGVTIVLMGPLLREHMFVGIVLVPPVLLKLGSTGYRLVRYYAGSRAYREKGPPPLALRLLAPVLVAATVAVLATGVALLVIGHRSDLVLQLHKIAFFVWGACFAVHFLWHLPRVARVVGSGLTAARGERPAGSLPRTLLVSAALGGGLVLALALLSLIDGWQRGRGG